MKKSYNLLKNTTFSLSILYLSLSLIFGYIETIFPLNLGVIGVRIGLSNIITILGLKTIGKSKTFLICLLRLVILGILFNNIIRFIISASGLVLSYIIMVLCFDILNFGIVSTSIFGAVFHNIGQIIAVSIISKNVAIIKILQFT